MWALIDEKICYSIFMKVIMLYRPNSDHETRVESYVRDYNRRTGKDIDLVNVNTREGDATAQLYDVMRYPALIATQDNGGFLKAWQDEMLPLIDEVSYYDSL